MSSWLNNPVAVKELRGRMRGGRAFVVLTLYLLALSAIVAFVYLVFTTSSASPGNSAARLAGKVLFAAIVGVQVFLVTFIGPAFTAGAISGERERQTFDLLRTTLLPAESLVRGKLISALSYIFLLVLVSIPLQSIAFLLGGLSVVELVVSQACILVAAVAYALYGLWCSATLRSTLAATVATFAGMLFITFGTPLLAGFVTTMIAAGFRDIPSSPLLETLTGLAAIVAAATHLPATLVTSEVFYLQEDAILATTLLSGSGRLWLPLPWPLFLVFYLLAALWFYRSAVRHVRRVSDE